MQHVSLLSRLYVLGELRLSGFRVYLDPNKPMSLGLPYNIIYVFKKGRFVRVQEGPEDGET